MFKSIDNFKEEELKKIETADTTNTQIAQLNNI